MTTVRKRRNRHILKWIGLGLSAIILVAWALSLLYMWEWAWRNTDRSGWWLALYGHVIMGGRIDPHVAYDYGPGWRVTRASGHDLWTHPPYCRWPVVTSSGGVLPLWTPFLLIAIPTAILFWRDRRRFPPGHCQHCGYDLTGNLSGLCSECGAPTQPRKPQAARAQPPSP